MPPRNTRPAVGSSNPPTIRSVVVLPQPDGPSMAKKLPRGISRLRSSTASVSAKRFVTPSRRISLSAVSCGVGPVSAIASIPSVGEHGVQEPRRGSFGPGIVHDEQPLRHLGANRPTEYNSSMPPRPTGLSSADAQDDFLRARRRQALSRLRARAVRRGDFDLILPFDEVVAALGRVGERDL